VLSSGADASGAVAGRLVEVERAVARELQDNVRRTLAPHLGLDNFEVSVAARLNVDKRQVNETAFDPDSRVERSRRVVKETGSSHNSAARANVSVEQNVPTDQPGASGADQSKRANDRREELTNYEIGSRSTTTVSDGYKIDSLAVAIVVNRKRIAAALGDQPSQEAIDKQVAEIERLAGSAAGLDAKRGDRVTIAALDFAEAPQPADSGAMWPALFACAGALIKALTVLALAFLVIRFGLRPAGRALLALPAPARQAEAGALAGAGPATSDLLALSSATGAPHRRPCREARARARQAARADRRSRCRSGRRRASAVAARGVRRMALQPAFRLLADFGARPVVASRAAPAEAVAREAQQADESAQAYERGLAEGLVQGLAALEARLAEERADLHARLAAERRARLIEQGEALGRDLARGLAALQTSIADAVAAVLEPWLEARARASAMAGLRNAIDRALGGVDGLTVRASGPPELLEALAQSLAGRDVRVVLAPEEGPGLRVGIHTTRIAVAVSGWLQPVEEDAA
jgi:hypothetical protein